DDAAEPRDVRLHLVHADAAAADLGDGRFGGEARREDQVVRLFSGELGRRLRREQATTHRGLAERLGVDARPVVLDLDDDVLPLLIGVERERPRGGLLRELTDLRRLDSVIDGVADDVHQRIAELLDDELVDLGLLAGDDEADLLAVLARDLAHDARELLEDLPERHHADVEDAVLELEEVTLEAAVDAVQIDGELTHPAHVPEPLGHADHGAPDDRELAHDVHEVVELLD